MLRRVTETHDTSAAKLVALLEVLAGSDTASREGLTVAEVARALGRDKSVVSRQLRSPVELGLIERDADGRHRLGWRLFAIAAKAGDQRLLLLAPPVMRRLTQLVRERVHLSIRRGPEVFTILSEGTNRSIEATGWVGRTTPITCTSSGRALLVDHNDNEIRELLADRFVVGHGSRAPKNVDELIERVAPARQRGYAAVIDEFDDDISGVAAPVRDVHGQIIAALNLSAPSYRLKQDLGTAGRHVSQAALHLSRGLASPPEQTQ